MAARYYKNGLEIDRRSVTTYMTEEMYQSLDDYCEALDTSKSGLLRYLFEEYRREHPISELVAEEPTPKIPVRCVSMYLGKEAWEDLDAYVSAERTSRTMFMVKLFDEFRREHPIEDVDICQFKLF